MFQDKRPTIPSVPAPAGLRFLEIELLFGGRTTAGAPRRAEAVQERGLFKGPHYRACEWMFRRQASALLSNEPNTFRSL